MESTFSTKSGSGNVWRSGLQKHLGAKRGSRAIKKLEKTGRCSINIPSPGKFKIKIGSYLAAASSTGASTEVSSAGKISDIDVDDDGTPTITF